MPGGVDLRAVANRAQMRVVLQILRHPLMDIIAIPQIEFVQENTPGSSTLFNVRKATYRAVYVSNGLE